MSNLLKVKDRDDLVREPYSKALLQIDREALLAHRRKKQMVQEMINNTKRIDSLENDMKEIKELLQILVQNSKVE